MNKLFAMLMLALVVVSSVDARGGGGRGGGGRGGGFHRGGGGRSWHGGRGWGGRGWGGRGWYGRRGWWGPGWGWGTGLALTVPVGSSTTYVEQVPAGAPTPCGQYQAATGAHPSSNPDAYRQWLFRNYTAADANYWWNNYLSYGC